MIDGTTDVSHKEMYSFVIGYTESSLGNKCMLSLQEVPRKVGQDTCQLLVYTLKLKAVYMDKLDGSTL